ncbi:hypothetical protein CRG98_012523 [Punica granatum]|uniref:LOB domain-containing protein n=1 Tax=Punica granatum TaxID=22663 RepID=A0A2I0KF14_PUNGR|nr:hypothetical protein CRG98_012523 [Punica granatum]
MLEELYKSRKLYVNSYRFDPELANYVVNLQSELAYVQARLSTFRSFPSPPSLLNSQPSLQATSSDHMALVLDNNISSYPNLPVPPALDPIELLQQATGEMVDSSDTPSTQQLADAQLQAIAREFISRYLPGVKIEPPGPPKGFQQ